MVNRYYEHGITSLTEPVRPGAAGTQKNEASDKAKAFVSLLTILREK
jgi:hypothetical protein